MRVFFIRRGVKFNVWVNIEILSKIAQKLFEKNK